ncbi:MAG: XrtA system polysaccharide deacetylase [Acidobacteriota bacterium]
MPSHDATLNALTVDVEDYFQVQAFADVISPLDWDRFESRVENNTYRVLDLLAENGIKGTFFVLGWEAERRPGIVRRITGEGHELACHGYGHQLVYRIGPVAFREDVRRAKSILEDISGKPVLGYRAPSYSITARSLWALDILAEQGFLYDSSIVPARHDVYGIPGAPRFPYRVRCEAAELTEFPPSTMQVGVGALKATLPVGGGGYLRLYPRALTHWGLETINNREGHPFSVYVHPWELDPHQPKLSGSRRSRFRHYHNIHRTERDLGQLLKRFRFGPMGRVIAALDKAPIHDPRLKGAA